MEEAPDEGPKITTLTGTQPQAKLGQLVDTTMTTQYLARVKTALLNDLEMSGSTIAVDTVTGVVTLTGRTPSAMTAERADRVTRSIDGVTDVVVRLQIGSSTL